MSGSSIAVIIVLFLVSVVIGCMIQSKKRGNDGH